MAYRIRYKRTRVSGCIRNRTIAEVSWIREEGVHTDEGLFSKEGFMPVNKINNADNEQQTRQIREQERAEEQVEEQVREERSREQEIQSEEGVTERSRSRVINKLI